MAGKRDTIVRRECGWNERMSPNVGIPDYFTTESALKLKRDRQTKRNCLSSKRIGLKRECSLPYSSVTKRTLHDSPEKLPLDNRGGINAKFHNATHDYVSATFGFTHHEGTDKNWELICLKHIIVRESLLSKIRRLVKKINDDCSLSNECTDCEILTKFLAEIRIVSVRVIESIYSWRIFSSRDETIFLKPFVWRTQNYLNKMWQDLDFISTCVPLMLHLEVSKENMVQNPLMLPSSLENAPDPINWIGLSDSSLLLVDEDLLIADKTKKKERIRFRRAEAALVVERFLPRLQRELKENEMRKLVIEVISTKYKEQQSDQKNIIEETSHESQEILIPHCVHQNEWQHTAREQLVALGQPQSYLTGQPDPSSRDENEYLPRTIHQSLSTLPMNISIQRKRQDDSSSSSSSHMLLPNNHCNAQYSQELVGTKRRPMSAATTLNTTHPSLRMANARPGTTKSERKTKDRIFMTFSTTEDVISLITQQDINSILQMDRPSRDSALIGRLFLILLNYGDLPDDTSWTKFKSKLGEGGTCSMRAVSIASFNGDAKEKVLKTISHKRSSLNRITMQSVAMAKIAAWSLSCLRQSGIESKQLSQASQRIDSFLRLMVSKKDITHWHHATGSKGNNTCLPGKKVKLNSPEKGRELERTDHSRKRNQLQANFIHGEISNTISAGRDIFVSCFEMENNKVLVKAYDPSSSEEYRLTVQNPCRNDQKRNLADKWIREDLVCSIRLGKDGNIFTTTNKMSVSKKGGSVACKLPVLDQISKEDDEEGELTADVAAAEYTNDEGQEFQEDKKQPNSLQLDESINDGYEDEEFDCEESAISKCLSLQQSINENFNLKDKAFIASSVSVPTSISYHVACQPGSDMVLENESPTVHVVGNAELSNDEEGDHKSQFLMKYNLKETIQPDMISTEEVVGASSPTNSSDLGGFNTQVILEGGDNQACGSNSRNYNPKYSCERNTPSSTNIENSDDKCKKVDDYHTNFQLQKKHITETSPTNFSENQNQLIRQEDGNINDNETMNSEDYESSYTSCTDEGYKSESNDIVQHENMVKVINDPVNHNTEAIDYSRSKGYKSGSNASITFEDASEKKSVPVTNAASPNYSNDEYSDDDSEYTEFDSS